MVLIVELTLTPNAAIFSMHSTVNIPVKHMFMYFSVFLYASLCRWNCNAYTDKHTSRERQTNGRTKPIQFPAWKFPPSPSPLFFTSSEGEESENRRGGKAVSREPSIANAKFSFSFRSVIDSVAANGKSSRVKLSRSIDFLGKIEIDLKSLYYILRSQHSRHGRIEERSFEEIDLFQV